MTMEMVEGEFIATMDDPDDPEMFQANAIHTTEGAREYGFDGAFVGGVTLYAWCVPTIVSALGEEWLDRGWVNIRFRRPTYPGSRVRVRVAPGDGPAARAFAAVHDDGQASIVGEVGLGTAPWLGDLTQTPFLPPEPEGGERPFLTLDNAPIGGRLRRHPYGKRITAPASVGPVLSELAELEAASGPVMHPSTVARQMGAMLKRSYDYGHPAIHVSSHVQNFARIPADADLVLCGTLVNAYERNGHHFAVIDADLYSAGGDRLARQRHVNIIKVRRASDAS